MQSAIQQHEQGIMPIDRVQAVNKRAMKYKISAEEANQEYSQAIKEANSSLFSNLETNFSPHLL